jgi:hypothetical protein
MLSIFLKILIIVFLAGCSALQPSEQKGEYRYVPITDRLKELSTEDFASRLRGASLVCENEMLTVYVPSRVIDEAGWEAGQNERRRYFKNCMELKGFERKFFSAKAIQRLDNSEKRDFRDEDYIEKPRFY